MNEHKQLQLRSLAAYNGTLREDGWGGRGGRRFGDDNFGHDIVCGFCGEPSHPTSDCPMKNVPGAKSKMDREYESFLNEIGAGGGGDDGAFGGGAPRKNTQDEEYEDFIASIGGKMTPAEPAAAAPAPWAKAKTAPAAASPGMGSPAMGRGMPPGGAGHYGSPGFDDRGGRGRGAAPGFPPAMPQMGYPQYGAPTQGFNPYGMAGYPQGMPAYGQAGAAPGAMPGYGHMAAQPPAAGVSAEGQAPWRM